ncbi:MAG TPA: hypothetical protein VG621_02180 [Candidatus Paceibacterota bacterium]|nr:hypothetical protein [Candidatus Paceibacterota bacterium]
MLTFPPLIQLLIALAVALAAVFVGVATAPEKEIDTASSSENATSEFSLPALSEEEAQPSLLVDRFEVPLDNIEQSSTSPSANLFFTETIEKYQIEE